jgi:hypothetical protein
MRSYKNCILYKKIIGAIELMRWSKHVAHKGIRNAYIILVGKLERKKSLGQPKR